MLRAIFSQGFFFFFFAGDPQSIFKALTEAKYCSAPHGDFGVRWERPGQGWEVFLNEDRRVVRRGLRRVVEAGSQAGGQGLLSQAGEPMKTHQSPPSDHPGLQDQGSPDSVILATVMTLPLNGATNLMYCIFLSFS